MFSIYKFMYDNGMCDKSYLLSCVPDAGLSKAEYQEIVGDSNEREDQPTAYVMTIIFFGLRLPLDF